MKFWHNNVLLQIKPTQSLTLLYKNKNSSILRSQIMSNLIVLLLKQMLKQIFSNR